MLRPCGNLRKERCRTRRGQPAGKLIIVASASGWSRGRAQVQHASSSIKAESGSSACTTNSWPSEACASTENILSPRSVTKEIQPSDQPSRTKSSAMTCQYFIVKKWERRSVQHWLPPTRLRHQAQSVPHRVRGTEKSRHSFVHPVRKRTSASIDTGRRCGLGVC